MSGIERIQSIPEPLGFNNAIWTKQKALPFKAIWTQENKRFDETPGEKITRCLFFVLNHIAAALVLPSSNKSQEEINEINQRFERNWTIAQDPASLLLQDQFNPIPIEVTTPDEVKIKGTFFKNRSATDTSPTVIFFQPNGTLSKQGYYDWVMEQAALQEIPYNFVYFDYRGCDGSTIKPRSEKDFFLDGESIYQFVRDHLHVSPSNIHFYGWSLGGGVSSHVKEIHQECSGNYVNERSFTSINDTINNILGSTIGSLAGLFTSLLNWKIDSAKAIENLNGKTLIVHHPGDELMKNEASLYRHFFEKRAGSVPRGLSHLDLSQSKKIFTPWENIHGERLCHFKTNDFNAEGEISKFLFNSGLSLNQRMIQIFKNSSEKFKNKVYEIIARDYQKGGYYWGSGADACYSRNGLTLSETRWAEAIVTAKQENIVANTIIMRPHLKVGF